MRVLNKRNPTVKDSDGVYIGRPGRFGNPFMLGYDGNRKQVIKKFETWIKEQPELLKAVKKELKGKSFICWCAPQPCHGDVLMRIANEEEGESKPPRRNATDDDMSIPQIF